MNGFLCIEKALVAQNHVQGIDAVPLTQQEVIPIPGGEIFGGDVHHLVVQYMGKTSCFGAAQEDRPPF